MQEAGLAWWLALVGMAAAWAMTGGLVRLTPRFGLVDVPNPRSSHTKTTPRGGGLAIVVVVMAVAVLTPSTQPQQHGLLLAVLVGGGLIALVGLVDDWRRVPPLPRLGVHLIAAVIAVLAIGGPTAVSLGTGTLLLGWLGPILAAIAVVWLVNLYNFMDGIDGIAAGEAVFVGVAGAAVFAAAGQTRAATLSLVVAAASLGFLGWNWSPARIFMGDVGSGFIGYVIASLVLAGMAREPLSLWPWLILTGAFTVDATVTLLHRLVRSERIYQAHRSHAYQHLARRWRSHGLATCAFLAVNLLWLAPWTWAASRWPEHGWLHALAALLPLALAALLAGAGHPEAQTD